MMAGLGPPVGLAGSSLTVRIVQEPNCFISLPAAHASRLLAAGAETPLVLELSPSHPSSSLPMLRSSRSVAWGGGSSRGASEVDVPSALAACLGLESGAVVTLRARPSIPVATRLELEPVSPDDWEVCELHAGFLEEQILNQVGVLEGGCVYPFFVDGQCALKLRVTATAPGTIVRLGRGVEIAVKPLLRHHHTRNPSQGRGPGMDALSHPSEETKPFCLRALHAVEGRHFKCKGNLLVDGTIVAKVRGTCLVVLSRSCAQKHGIAEGGLVEVGTCVSARAARWRRALVAVVVSDVVPPGHAALPPLLLRHLLTKQYESIQLRPLEMNADAKASPSSSDNSFGASPTASHVVIHPLRQREMLKVGGGGPRVHRKNSDFGEEPADGVSAELDPKFARAMVSAWSQIHASLLTTGAGGSNKDGGKADEDDAMVVPVPDGSIMQVVDDEGKPTFFLLRLTHLDSSVADRAYGSRLSQEAGSSLRSFARLRVSDLGASGGGTQHMGTNNTAVEVGSRLRWEIYADTRGSCVEEAMDVKDLGWLGKSARSAIGRLRPRLSRKLRREVRSLGAPFPGSPLLVGSSGCGKTTAVMAVARALQADFDCVAYPHVVNCSRLKGKRPSVIAHSIREAAAVALRRSPALLVLDNLDAIAPADDEDGGGAEQDAGTATASLLADIFEEFLDGDECRGQPTGLIATAADASAVAPVLRSPGFFDFPVAIHAPSNTKEREGLLMSLLARMEVTAAAALQVGAETCEGFDVTDLRLVCERAVHAAHVRTLHRDTNTAVEVLEEDVEEALSGFVSSLERKAGTTKRRTAPKKRSNGSTAEDKNSEVRTGWARVGGLTKVKAALEESLTLPIRHAELFANAPLKLCTSSLLYGPPGSGKTFLASVAAEASGLRVISVKGPELLNKYIGASEAAVRDVFARASAAAPCILLLDELDSIAPRRGQDNTGVTDRVVNQILTEMDGVEDLKGVFVLGTTSRPDLIDPALLRPGRLDSHLYCNFPDAAERVDILQALSEPMHLNEDVELAQVARYCEGMTGADIGGLLSDAHLIAANEVISSGKVKKGMSCVPVCARHLQEAMRSFRPSISSEERARLEVSYRLFQRHKGDKVTTPKKKQVTLA